MNARLQIDTDQGYTCYNASGVVLANIARGAEDFEIAGILLNLKKSGATTSYMLRSEEYAVLTGYLECGISPECQEKYIDMLHMSGLTNAHAELPNRSNYDYKVCCKSISVSLSNTCSGQNTPFLSLAYETNSHVSYANLSDYPIGICLNFNSTYYRGEYSYEAGGGCEYGTCVVVLAQETNSHAASCDDKTYNKLCYDIYNKSLSMKERRQISKGRIKYPIIFGEFPEKNEKKTFKIDGEATEASIAPVVSIGFYEKVCDVTSRVQIPKCAV